MIGLGRFGSAVAVDLEERGVKVLGIDGDEATVQELADSLPHVVIADATDEEALRQLDVADYDLAVVAIGKLEMSVLVVSMLTQLGVRTIWAKALSPMHATLLSRMGAVRVVQPEREAGLNFSHMITGGKRQFARLDDDLAVARTEVPRELTGAPLSASHLPARLGIGIVSYRRPGGEYRLVRGDTVLEPGDEIIVAGPPKGVDAIGKMD